MQSAPVVVAKQDWPGDKKAGFLPLYKGGLYWVEPSATQAGWMLGHNSDGNQGRFPEVGSRCAHYCTLLMSPVDVA